MCVTQNILTDPSDSQLQNRLCDFKRPDDVARRGLPHEAEITTLPLAKCRQLDNLIHQDADFYIRGYGFCFELTKKHALTVTPDDNDYAFHEKVNRYIPSELLATLTSKGSRHRFSKNKFVDIYVYHKQELVNHRLCSRILTGADLCTVLAYCAEVKDLRKRKNVSSKYARLEQPAIVVCEWDPFPILTY